jgi:hypothetical protein
MESVTQWLDQLGLSQHAEVFAKNDIDLEALCLLTDADLERLGVSLGHRKELLKAIADVTERGASSPRDTRSQPSPPSSESGNVEAERRQLTVVFCDLAGSTALATELHPEPLRVFRVLGARAADSRFEAARSESALTPLVGREEEVALPLRRWQEAEDGEGQVVLIGGDPGIGKSRLTRVLRERLVAQRYTPLRSQCSPYHLHSTLYPGSASSGVDARAQARQKRALEGYRLCASIGPASDFTRRAG